jgi:hypothetical protein
MMEFQRLYREGINNELVQDGFRDPYMYAASEIRTLQKENPDSVIYVIDESRRLAWPTSGYGFLYDRNRCRMISAVDPKTPPGFLVAVGKHAVAQLSENPDVEVARRYATHRDDDIMVGRVGIPR